MRRHTTKRSFWINCIQELGTITGRGFLDRYIREQGTIKTQEEEDKVSGRTGGKKNIINKTTRQKLKTLVIRGAEV